MMIELSSRATGERSLEISRRFAPRNDNFLFTLIVISIISPQTELPILPLPEGFLILPTFLGRKKCRITCFEYLLSIISFPCHSALDAESIYRFLLSQE